MDSGFSKQYITPNKGVFFPHWLLQCRGISASAKIVYAQLCQQANANGEWVCQHSKLAKDCGLNNADVLRCLDDLEQFRLIVASIGDESYVFLHHPIMDGKP